MHQLTPDGKDAHLYANCHRLINEIQKTLHESALTF